MVNVFDLLNTRTKDLDRTRFAHKLIGTVAPYGMDVVLGEPEIDEARMAAWITFADGNRRDGVGDLLEVTGIDTSRHRKNPIILFDHGKHYQMPVAKAEDPDTGEYTCVIDPIGRLAKDLCFFYQGKGLLPSGRTKTFDHAVFCEQLFDLLAKRFLRAGSIGYQVKMARHLQADPETGTPKGLHLLAVRKLEASVVVLPANQDTVKSFDWVSEILAKPKICGRAKSPYLVKSLSPYIPVNTSVSVAVPQGQDHTKTNYKPARWKPGIGAVGTSFEDHHTRGEKGKFANKDKKASLLELMKKADAKKRETESPDYGSLFLNSKTGDVWYVTADGDSREFTRWLFPELEKIVGKGKVKMEAEASPKKGQDGWEKIHNGLSSKSLEVETKDQPRESDGRFAPEKTTKARDPKKKSDKECSKCGAETTKKNDPLCAKCRAKVNKDKEKKEGKSMSKDAKKELKRETKAAPQFEEFMDDNDGTQEEDPVPEVDGDVGQEVTPGEEAVHGEGETTDELIEGDGSDFDANGEEGAMSDDPNALREEYANAQVPAEEKYGAKVIRRVHKDYQVLMQDYHEMIQLLEESGVGEFVTKVLSQITSEMDEVEALFDTVYAEMGYPELEGRAPREEMPMEGEEGMEGDMPLEEGEEGLEGEDAMGEEGLEEGDPNAEEDAMAEEAEAPEGETEENEDEVESADSDTGEDQEDVSEEDVVEGMGVKSSDALRAHYKRIGKAPMKREYSTTIPEDQGVGHSVHQSAGENPKHGSRFQTGGAKRGRKLGVPRRAEHPDTEAQRGNHDKLRKPLPPDDDGPIDLANLKSVPQQKAMKPERMKPARLTVPDPQNFQTVEGLEKRKAERIARETAARKSRMGKPIGKVEKDSRHQFAASSEENKSMCRGCGKRPCHCGSKGVETEGEEDAFHKDMENSSGDETIKDVESQAHINAPKLKKNHHGPVGEAGAFLSEIGKDKSVFDREHQLKAYHYGKTLEGIHKLYAETDKEDKSLDDEETKDMEGETETKSWHKCMKDAADFMTSDLATTKSFGCGHREKSLSHAEALNRLIDAKKDDEEEDEEDKEEKDDEESVADGAMKTKDDEADDIKSLRSERDRQMKIMKDLEESMSRILV